MNATTEWYRNLNKPAWAPAENVFGIVWSVLYPIIFAVNVYVFVLVVSRKVGWQVGLPFWINLAANLAYTPVQFGLRNNTLALVDIVVVLVTIIWAMVAIWPHAKWATLAYVPYLLWVSIATVLQITITWMNK